MHVNNPSAEVFLKDGSLNAGPDDSAFLQSLRRSLKTSRGAYPPVALAEIYREYKLPLTKIRRLHLMVVDLDTSRSVSTYVYQDFQKCHIPTDLAGCLNTLPVPISRKDCPFKVRFVFAYGVDNSDKPSCLLWPNRGASGQFLLVDPWSGNYFDLDTAKFMEPIGLEHFFDAFALDQKRSLFQATGLCSHKQRPPIMHAYGGAKSGMAQALQSIASEGWIPLAAAMVGTIGKQPLWADLGLRPVVGTTLDIKLGPRPLQHRDVALLLSCWKRWDFKSVADSAINTWLKGANTEYGPDCEDSPYFRIRNMDVLEAMRLFGECGFGSCDDSGAAPVCP